ncbi:MAG: RNA 2',3'-cyclic phosphodiesterase [Rhodospirillales bacterium]|nr:RNA 2',3'-cyclic phosphodiesterase [Rhodospirillales bacterium]
MPRLFVALPVPPESADRLLEFRTSLPGVRWLAPQSLHLTLRFLGKVDSASLPEIDEALHEIRQPPVPVQCVGLDMYQGADRRPRAIVRAVENQVNLAGLHRAVEQALRSFDSTGRRRFKPHVTLARINRSARRSRLQYCLDGAGLLEPVTWLAEGFSLYSSHLGREGAVYTAEATYPLRVR